MIHYLVIGHGDFEEPEHQMMMFNDYQPDEYIEKKFIKKYREDWNFDEDKEVYIDFIFRSKTPISTNQTINEDCYPKLDN
tara:strand:- start:559 stop:798 length:240 start_codon:yes stop_codon:yes gene_type:complete